MTLFVLAVPEFSEEDGARIDLIRARLDPQHGVVPPHVTVVFGTDAIGAAGLEAHLRPVARRYRAFDVVFRAAAHHPASEPHEDDYTFLVPDEGNSTLIRLHDALYSGVLAKERRLDLPFVPHVTIARGARSEMARLASAWNAEEPPAQARIGALDIVELAPGGATTLVSVALG